MNRFYKCLIALQVFVIGLTLTTYPMIEKMPRKKIKQAQLKLITLAGLPHLKLEQYKEGKVDQVLDLFFINTFDFHLCSGKLKYYYDLYATKEVDDKIQKSNICKIIALSFREFNTLKNSLSLWRLLYKSSNIKKKKLVQYVDGSQEIIGGDEQFKKASKNVLSAFNKLFTE